MLRFVTCLPASRARIEQGWWEGRESLGRLVMEELTRTAGEESGVMKDPEAETSDSRFKCGLQKLDEE